MNIFLPLSDTMSSAKAEQMDVAEMRKLIRVYENALDNLQRAIKDQNKQEHQVDVSTMVKWRDEYDRKIDELYNDLREPRYLY